MFQEDCGLVLFMVGQRPLIGIQDLRASLRVDDKDVAAEFITKLPWHVGMNGTLALILRCHFSLTDKMSIKRLMVASQ